MIRLIFFLLVASFCFGQPGDFAVSAKGDDTKALQDALDAACEREASPKVHLPAGVYNISSPLITRCSMSIHGDGPAASIIVQTVHRKLNHGIVAGFPLELEDLSIHTSPLTKDLAMVAVFSMPQPSAKGFQFTFVRFNSDGFNFGLDVNGNGDTDLLHSVVVKDCRISVGTQANAVSSPINAANAEFLSVEDSALTGDQNNDHAIYAIGIRRVHIENNVMENHANSAIKLLAGGFGPTAVCPAENHDYSTWTIRNNVIRHSKLALAAYTYCAVELPELNISKNRIVDIPNTYEGDTAAVYIQATCQSAIGQVTMSDNLFRDIGLSAVFLLSSVQRSSPCEDLKAKGTIRNFISTSNQFVNFSTSYPGRYSAITSSGANLIHATVSGTKAPLNLAAFRQVAIE